MVGAHQPPWALSAQHDFPAWLPVVICSCQTLCEYLACNPSNAESWLTSHARAVADEEAQLGGSSIALMQNLIPAVAVLLLGFICREGEELVRCGRGGHS